MIARLLLLLSPLAFLHAAGLELEIPAVKTNLRIEDQAVTVIASGRVSIDGAIVSLRMDADLSDLQEKITPILRAQLNQDNRCGERMSIEKATLDPAQPAALLTVNLHYEKFGCAKAFGKEMMKRLVGGDAVIQVRLTAAVDPPDSVRLHADVLSIDAGGSLGDLLHSGSLGDAIQEKIRRSVTSAVEKSTAAAAALPAVARDIAAIQTVEFAGAADRRLRLLVHGEVHATAEQAAALAAQLERLRPNE